MASYAFRIRGIEPTHDPAWKAAPPALRRAFWRAVVQFGLEAKDRELAAGLDKDGAPMARISAYTRAHRKSAMGPADPNAPPLTPAYGLSRTRSLLRGRVQADHAEFYWAYDPHTGMHWGKILGYHRAGIGKPVRDVIGISPQSLAWVKHKAWEAWGKIKLGLEYQTTRDDLTIRSTAPPSEPPKKIAVVGRVDLENVSGWKPGEQEKIQRAIDAGYFTGFRQFHPDGTTSAPGVRRAPTITPPKPAPVAAPRVITLKPPPRPQLATPTPALNPRRMVAGVSFVPAAAAKSQRMQTVWIDIAKLDAAFQRDKGFAIGPNGEGAIPGRIPGFLEFLKHAKAAGIPIEQSQVVIGSDGSVSFVDGRHRFSVFRDQGVKRLPISVPRSQVNRARKFLGAD